MPINKTLAVSLVAILTALGCSSATGDTDNKHDASAGSAGSAGASINGRLLAQTAVTIDTSTVVEPAAE